MPFDLENCEVRGLGIHVGIIPASQAVDQSSLVRLLSLGSVSVLKLQLTYPPLEELLQTGPLSGHRVFVEIRKLVLKVSVSYQGWLHDGQKFGRCKNWEKSQNSF